MTSFADHWVRIMADYGANGVWDSDGYACTVDELPLTEELKTAIRAWADWYDRDCEYGLPNPRPFPLAEFASQGLVLAQRVKSELPHWTIIYFDEERAMKAAGKEPRSVYEYEIKEEDP